MSFEPANPHPRRLSIEIAVLLAYLVGAIVFTYPLVTDLDGAVKDIGDPLLDAWAIAWVAHQLPRDPVHLFDANRYYPESSPRFATPWTTSPMRRA